MKLARLGAPWLVAGLLALGAACTRPSGDRAADDAATEETGESRLELAELHLQAAEAGDRERALDALSLLDGVKAGGRAELLRARALLARQPQDLGGAGRALTAARRAGLESVELDQLEGQIAIANGDLDTARRLLEPTLGQGRRPGWIALSLGQLMLERGEDERALSLLERATDELPESAEAAFRLAEARRALGDSGGAVEALDEALRRDPAHAGARLQRGRLRARAGEERNADLSIHEILLRDDELARHDPSDLVARAERSELAERCRALEPAVGEWTLRVARDRAERGECEPALALLASSRATLGQAGELARAAGIALRCGDAETALELADAALSAAPRGRPGAQGRLLALGVRGEALSALGRFEEALPALREAVALAPYSPAAHEAFARSLERSGRQTEAERELGLAERLRAGGGAKEGSGELPDLEAWIAAGPLSRIELAALLVRGAEDGHHRLALRAEELLEPVAERDGAAALLLARARLADENQDLGGARAALAQAERLGGADPVALRQFSGLIAFSLGEPERAAELLAVAKQGGPRDAQAEQVLAEIALEREEPELAAAHLQAAVGGAPTVARPAFLLARALSRLGDQEGQRAALDLAIEREPDHLGARLARGRLAASAEGAEGGTDLEIHRLLTRDSDLSRRPGSDQRAVSERLRIAEQLVAAEPAQPWWRARWAEQLVLQGRMPEAATVLRDAARLPSSRLVSGWLARLAYQCGDYALAESFAMRGLDQPDEPAVPPQLDSRLASTLGTCRLRQGRPGEAAPLLTEAVGLAPYQADLRVLRALALEQNGSRKAAIDEYRRALQLDPRRPRALANLGALLREELRPDEALLLLDEACRLAPQDAAAQANRGLTLGDLGRVQEALAALEIASGLAPRNAKISWALGAALANAGRPEEARPHLERAATDEGVGEQARQLLEAISR